METITSLQNPKIKQALKLWKKRERDERRLFLIEGYRELSRAESADIGFKTLFICPELFLGENEIILIEKIAAKNGEVIRCSEAVFRKLSYRDRPDGLIAIANHLKARLEDLPIKTAPFFIIAESIEKPGNLGTILRSSDATGADGVIICDRCTDIHNPNVVRASVGTLFTQPVVETEGEELFQWLKSHQIAILAATPSADLLYNQVNLRQPVAIVIGTEQYGLSQKWMDGADFKVKIPMLGRADSLNAAMAATILMYEVVRQRS